MYLVMSGHYLDLTSTKQRIKYLSQGYNAVPLVKLKPPRHCAPKNADLQITSHVLVILTFHILIPYSKNLVLTNDPRLPKEDSLTHA